MSQAENGSVAGALWRFAVAALLTAAVVYACWWLWEEIPQYVRRTPLQDYRYLVNLLAIFLFLPWCQLNRKHATVELLTNAFPRSLNRLLSLLWEAVFAGAILLIAWRLVVGMSDKMRYGETTFLLQMPVWWAFAACSFAAFFASLVAVYCVYLRAAETASGSAVQVDEGGFDV